MSGQTPIGMRGITVAIVDDDASVRASLSRLFKMLGLSATAYASGQEFLAALDGGASCEGCLLLDAHMPEMNGFELQRHLVARGAHIPTILFTGGDAPDPSHDMAKDFVGYLRKPVPALDLLAAIERALRDR